MDEKAPPDWLVIEMDFRAGVKTLRQIALEHGITHGAINQRAKRYEWTRDLSAKIRAKADEQVSRAALSKSVSKDRLDTEKQVVQDNAALQYTVRMAHRTDIQRVRNLLLMLLTEAEHQTEHRALYEALGELLRSPDEQGNDKLNDIYRKALSLPTRVGVLKQITDTLALLIRLEREAFGIDETKGLGAGGFEELLKRMGNAAA